MAISLSTAATRIAATAAAVATAMASGTTTAEATALADLLSVLSKRPDLSNPALALGGIAGAAQTGNLSITPG